nr:hypothetical protein [uncultured Flavobacterium sp.]
MTFYENNEVATILTDYKIDFIEGKGSFEIEDNQDLSLLPYKKVIKMLGLKKNEGHLCLVMKLNEIEPSWLYVFFKYWRYFEVYDDDGKIIKSHFYSLINDILDGLL